MQRSPIAMTPMPLAAAMPDRDAFDAAAAAREGWTVAEAGVLSDGTPSMQVQRIDCPEGGAPEFADDPAAWTHVVAQARAGSALHRQALLRIDKVERALIAMTCGTW